jgi:hypothetical protein
MKNIKKILIYLTGFNLIFCFLELIILFFIFEINGYYISVTITITFLLLMIIENIVFNYAFEFFKNTQTEIIKNQIVDKNNNLVQNYFSEIVDLNIKFRNLKNEHNYLKNKYEQLQINYSGLSEKQLLLENTVKTNINQLLNLFIILKNNFFDYMNSRKKIITKCETYQFKLINIIKNLNSLIINFENNILKAIENNVENITKNSNIFSDLENIFNNFINDTDKFKNNFVSLINIIIESDNLLNKCKFELTNSDSENIVPAITVIDEIKRLIDKEIFNQKETEFFFNNYVNKINSCFTDLISEIKNFDNIKKKSNVILDNSKNLNNNLSEFSNIINEFKSHFDIEIISKLKNNSYPKNIINSIDEINMILNKLDSELKKS